MILIEKVEIKFLFFLKMYAASVGKNSIIPMIKYRPRIPFAFFFYIQISTLIFLTNK